MLATGVMVKGKARAWVRIIAAMLMFAALGFVCGFFGPLYLLQDPGVGPITGFFAAPIGALIGIATAAHANMTTRTTGQYFLRLFVVAAIFAALILAMVVFQ